jgi:muramoyltetrapeptide carboxypeptidase
MEADKLEPGDSIGIIAPAYAVKEGQYDTIIAGIQKLGYTVITGKNLYKTTYNYSASEKERADDFNEMVSNAEVKMVLFGGGYVSNEIIPYIDYKKIKKNPKLFASYSDGTTILDVIYAKTGLITYYGQKPSTFADITDYNKESFIRNFVHKTNSGFIKNSEWRILNPGHAEGILTGGYIENFALLTGNKYFSYAKNKKYILFLEDYEKFCEPVRISMHLSYIEQNSLIKNITGLIFGHYSDRQNDDLSDRLQRFGRKNNIPVIYCDDFGHGLNNGIIPVGRNAALDTQTKQLLFL